MGGIKLISVLEVFGEPISRGGQESYVMNNLSHMDLHDIQVDLFTPYFCDNKNYIEFIEDNGGHIYQGNMPFVVGGTRREIIPTFRELLCKKCFDVVHIHSGSISVLAYYAREASRAGVKRVIVHSHSSGVRENIKHFLMKQYSANMFRKYATDYFACSIEAAKWKYPRDILPKVKILKNGVDLEKFRFDVNTRNRLRDEYSIKEDTLVLGHVGRFTYEKNQIFLVEMLAEYVKSNSNKDIALMLVGDGPERGNVEKRALELGISTKVIFIGTKDNVNEYMQAFDVFLFPSLYEGLGIVGIEAQASGLPVIASTGVPKTMKVLANTFFYDLNDFRPWIETISGVTLKRENNRKLIKQAGYDILDTSLELSEIYLGGLYEDKSRKKARSVMEE